MNPKVSIIVPVYNTEKYLDSCIKSIINQTYKNIEIILVDDGSTDNSTKIIQDFSKRDKRIKVIRQKNSGQSSARNTGLAKSTGEYISFIDSDDEVSTSFIEELMQPYINNDNICLSVCGLQYRWLKSNTTQDVFLKPIRKRGEHESKTAYILFLLTIDGRMYSSFNKIYKKSYISNVRFDTTLNFAEDTKFVLDYLKNTPNNNEISFILKPLCYYNYGTETSTLHKTAGDWKNWEISYTNLKEWVGKNPSPQEKFWLFMILCRWRISHHRAKKRIETQ